MRHRDSCAAATVRGAFLLAGALMVACAGNGSVTTPASPAAIVDRSAASAAIARELDDFHDAAARADEARYFAHFSNDAVFLGTDATERWDVAAFRAFAHPHFAAGKAWSFHATRRAITVSGDGHFGYFDEDLATEKLGPARGSGVVVLRDGGWKIAQYNLAVVVPNERFAELRALLERPAAPAADAGKRTQ
jgi:ketosteroid isomerase-like protein